MMLSIIIPVYNEEKTLRFVLKKIKSINLEMEKEIIVVDDGSTDKTSEILAQEKNLKIFSHKRNLGKGMAVKTGLNNCRGDIIIIQDADLEYDPEDIKLCLRPILNKQVRVVYGSRELKKENKSHSSWLFFLGGKIVTRFTNLLYHSHLTDEPTCYKCFEAELIKAIDIRGRGFEWEPEVTAKILRQGVEIKEVPISYFPRKQKEGKKIKYRDGFKALETLLKYRFKKIKETKKMNRD